MRYMHMHCMLYYTVFLEKGGLLSDICPPSPTFVSIPAEVHV